MASDAKKILLVEDEKAIRDAVAAYLEREGYWVVGVGDGQSRDRGVREAQFDLVVLDPYAPQDPRRARLPHHSLIHRMSPSSS